MTGAPAEEQHHAPARRVAALLALSALLLAVAPLALPTGHSWLRNGIMHVLFGLCMLGVAAVSTDSWTPGTVSVHSEALLHSILATVMGFAFVLGTGIVGLVRLRCDNRTGSIDLAAAIAATALCAGMGAAPGVYGMLQRPMFAVGYLWYAREALTDRNLARQSGSGDDTGMAPPHLEDRAGWSTHGNAEANPPDHARRPPPRTLGKAQVTIRLLSVARTCVGTGRAPCTPSGCVDPSGGRGHTLLRWR